jgi:hypothetical protein
MWSTLRTPLDALLVLNLLAANRTAQVPVSSLSVAPPPFYDVNGDGLVQPLDALLVITEIARRNRLQLGAGAEGESGAAAVAFDPVMLGSTSTVYAASSITLPQLDPSASTDPGLLLAGDDSGMHDPFVFDLDLHEGPTDLLAEDWLAAQQGDEPREEQSDAVDEALLSWMEPTNL